MRTIPMLLNLYIFAVTLFFTVRFFRKDGQWSLARGRGAFRFFTVQSNALCAASALLICLLPESREAWLLKYVGTAAVTVTMLTVLFFLGPAMGYGNLLKGSDLFMHLITPLAALISFCAFEKRGMGFGDALWGLVPVVVYGVWYLYKILYAPKEKRWEDFYGFNKTGKWPVSMAAMFLGAFAVCMGLMALQNI